MANQPMTEPQTAFSADDFREHQETYVGFLNMVKWSIIGLAVLLVFLYVVVRP